MEIEIKIEDYQIFTCAAFILDQDNFFNKILEIRTHWFLDEKLIHYSKFDDWLKELHYDFSLTPEVTDYWLSAKNKFQQDLSFTHVSTESSVNEETLQEIAYSNPMDLEIEFLLRKNGLTANYKNFVLRAIVCGEVTLIDWESISEDKKFYHKDWWFNISTYEKTYKGQPKYEIVRDREWYWQFKRGKTDIEIAQETTHRNEKTHPEDYKENFVKPALKRYRRFLKVKGRTQRL